MSNETPTPITRLTGNWKTKCTVCGRTYDNGVGSTPCCGALQEVIKDPSSDAATPETDDLITSLWGCMESTPIPNKVRDFARKLERQRDALQKRVEALEDSCRQMVEAAGKAGKEFGAEHSARIQAEQERDALKADKCPNLINLKWLKQLESALVEVSNVFQGWHSDGTAWSEYDQSVWNQINALHVELFNALATPDAAMSNEASKGGAQV